MKTNRFATALLLLALSAAVQSQNTDKYSGSSGTPGRMADSVTSNAAPALPPSFCKNIQTQWYASLPPDYYLDGAGNCQPGAAAKAAAE